MSEGWSYFLDFKDQVFELRDGEQSIGRSRTCDISVDDPSVSRRHATIEADSGRVVVRDLGSSNGTFVNGERIAESGELHQGDTLGLGDADVGVRVVGPSAFETVRMSSHPLEPQHGEATLFLQQASEKLAGEAMDHVAPPDFTEPASPPPATPSHMAPPPVAPAEPPAPAPSHMAPPPVAPEPVAPEPIVPEPIVPEPVTPEPTTPEPIAPAAPPPIPPEPVAPEPVAPEPVAPEPVAPEPVAPEPVAPEPVAPEPVAPEPVAPEPVAPEPVAPEPVAPAPPAPAPPPPAPPEPAAPAVAGGPETTGDLLPSLDGFDITMGPEMLAAMEPKSRDAEAAPAYNPYGAPSAGSAAGDAGFGIRLAAALVDAVWMGGLHLAVWFAGSDLGAALVSAVASSIGLLVVLFGWAIWGATPGKAVFKLHVNAGDSAQAGIGFPRAVARLIGYVASAVPLGAGFLMIAFSSSKRGLHDLIAGTRVERQGP